MHVTESRRASWLWDGDIGLPPPLPRSFPRGGGALKVTQKTRRRRREGLKAGLPSLYEAGFQSAQSSRRKRAISTDSDLPRSELSPISAVVFEHSHPL
jgi:hypothetical protein